MSLSSTNMAIETKGQRWRAIPTQYKKASDILTSTLAAFLFTSHPKKERDREAHLNYYASTHKLIINYLTTSTEKTQHKTDKTRSDTSPLQSEKQKINKYIC